jgi:hypothetical protein
MSARRLPSALIHVHPLIERTLVHLVDQAHALDHISTGTAQIHGLSAGRMPPANSTIVTR